MGWWLVNRGEVWWAATETGRRPVMVLSRQSVIPHMQRLVVVPATTNRRGIPSELDLDEDDGMPRECVLAFDNITHMSKSRLLKRICTIHGERLDEACRTLAITTGCID